MAAERAVQVWPLALRLAHWVLAAAALRTAAYLRAVRGGREPRHLGHNPPGAWMIVALLGGALFTSWRHRENLVRAMMDGRKRPPAGDDLPS